MEQNGDDEVIEGKPLREVGIVEVEEEESEGKDEVLLRGVCQGTAYQLHPHHCHHKGCTIDSKSIVVMVGTKVESKEKAERVEYVLLNEAPPLHYVFRNRHDWLLCDLVLFPLLGSYNGLAAALPRILLSGLGQQVVQQCPCHTCDSIHHIGCNPGMAEGCCNIKA